MNYFNVRDGLVVDVRSEPYHDCQYQTDEKVKGGWSYVNGVLAAPVPTNDELKKEAIASIYAPVLYGGKYYPVDTESMAKYEMAKQSKSRGKMSKGIAIATDGSILKLSSASAIDDFHTAMENAVIARVATIHDAI